MNSYLVSFAHINLVMVVIIDKFSSLISWIHCKDNSNKKKEPVQKSLTCWSDTLCKRFDSVKTSLVQKWSVMMFYVNKL